MPTTGLADAIELIKMEYAEMPALKLTFWQVQRLWDLSHEQCQEALTALTKSGFLRCTRDGLYQRGDSSLASIEHVRRARIQGREGRLLVFAARSVRR